MAESIFVWDGTEDGLFDLLIWWSKVYSEWEYGDQTVDEILDRALTCFQPPKGNAVIGAEARMTKHDEPIPLYFEFIEGKKAGRRWNVNAGDMFFFKDGKYSFKESFECVVQSQDWP